MMFKRLTIGVIFLLFSFITYAQSKGEMIESAQYYFENKEYDKAYELYDKLNTKSPKDLQFQFQLGLCCLNYPEKKKRAIEIFEAIKKNTKTTDATFYLGKAYHANYIFDKAIVELEDYKANSKNNSKEEKKLYEEATILINNCKSAQVLIENKVVIDFKNMGSPINTEEDEYVPSITTDESMMLFNYRGKKSVGGKVNGQLEPDEIEGQFNEDVYLTLMNPDSTWSDPISVAEVNTKGNDAAISISPDGRNMFMFKSDAKNSGDIYLSVLTGTAFSKPEPLNEYINSDYWEGSCSISADGQVLYFASERPGGKGGRDIWASVKINGDWGPAVNLGPTINTELDEDAPFIHPDGITLFFSSKGHQSIGGYDIMYSIMKENQWTPPRNIGIPLNTTEDDRYYVINSTGNKGYFSSNRAGSGGKGKQDIYTVSPGIPGEKPIIALLKGVIYGNDKPIEANIEILKNVDGKLIGPFISNNITGKYLTALSPGSTYRIKVFAEGYESLVEDFDIQTLDKYKEVKKDFYLYTKAAPDSAVAVVTPTNETVTTPTETAVVESNSPCAAMSLPDFSPLKGKSLNNPENYKMLLDMAGNYCAQGLVFKVQIGAYRKPQNYKYKNLADLGKPQVVDYPDGITRFTQKEFATITEAEKHRQKTISRGQTDAWIVAFVNGKRYTVEELINLDFLGKSIN